MFCQHCGKQIEDDATFCPNCGAKVGSAPAPQGEKDEFFKDVPAPAPVQQQQQQPVPQQTYQAQQPAKSNTLAMVGFIMSFFVAIAGLICSIIGLKQCNQTGEGGRGLAIAGIIISAVSMFMTLIGVIIIITTIGSLPLYDYYYY